MAFRVPRRTTTPRWLKFSIFDTNSQIRVLLEEMVYKNQIILFFNKVMRY